jgi:hypothetical protein
MEAITIPANTLKVGDTVRISGVVRVEEEPHLTVDFERFMGTERLERARARHEKRLRKPLLSGRYGKRRRQRAQGVARMRHINRQVSRLWLALVEPVPNAQ